MGVGNWSWNSLLATDVVHVDVVNETFDEYRNSAQAQFVEFVKARHPHFIDPHSQLTLQWAEENGHRQLIQDAVADDFPWWDDERNFAIDTQRDRFDALSEELKNGVAQANRGPGPLWKVGSSNGSR